MKVSAALAVAAIAVLALVVHDAAEARVGGGKSSGAQRPSVTPRAAAPTAATPPAGAAAQPVMPAQPGAALAGKPAGAAAAPSGGSRWLGPIAGLAAGLGLAALLSHFGLPEGLGSFLLIALLVVGVVFALRLFFARRQPAYAGARDSGTTGPNFEKSPAPEWGGQPRVEPMLRPNASAPVAGKPLPPGFDAAGFARHAKTQFIQLQAAHHAGDREAFRDMLTPAMFSEVMRELDSGAERPATEVVTLDAEVLEVETEGDSHWVSVRFSGTLREDGASVALDEVWNLSKPVDGKTGWLLAGIQQRD